MEKLSFEEDEMRQHLTQWLQSESLESFPRTTGSVRRCRRKHCFVHVHCVCQLPSWYDCNMIQCEQCKKWFHFKCVGIHNAPDSSWFCNE